MEIVIKNQQKRLPIGVSSMRRLAACALKELRIRAQGTLVISFIGARLIRKLNKEFMGHDWVTDVLCFRYDKEPILGDILIAPSQAKSYAASHGLNYHEELSRYVVHGILHWRGWEDTTKDQQQRMRRREDRLLAVCAP